MACPFGIGSACDAARVRFAAISCPRGASACGSRQTVSGQRISNLDVQCRGVRGSGARSRTTCADVGCRDLPLNDKGYDGEVCRTNTMHVLADRVGANLREHLARPFRHPIRHSRHLTLACGYARGGSGLCLPVRRKCHASLIIIVLVIDAAVGGEIDPGKHDVAVRR